MGFLALANIEPGLELHVADVDMNREDNASIGGSQRLLKVIDVYVYLVLVIAKSAMSLTH